MSAEKLLKNGNLFWRYSLTILAVALATGARFGLDFVLKDILSPFILFYPAVMFSAWCGGFSCAVFSILLSILAGNYFFIEPRYTFNFSQTLQILHTSVFVFTSFVIVLLAENLHQSLVRRKKSESDLI